MKKHLLCGALLVFALSIGSFSVIARASSIPSPLTGWAWSSNVGWISFSSTDSGTGDGGVIGTYSPKAYGVYVSTTTSGGVTTGTFSGYAWSPNVGWISFNASDLDSSPVCLPGGSNNAATANLTTGSVTGYARVLSGVGNSIWDGCIELSGNNHASPDLGNITINGGQYLKGGVTFQMHTVSTGVTQGLFGGFGWDSGVLGWINFASGLSGSTGVTCPGCGNQPVNPNMPSVSCAPDNDSPVSGGTVTFIASIIAGGAGGPYSYSWNSGSYASQFSYSQVYNSAGSGPTVSAKDSGGAVSSVITCPSITINNNPTVDSHLKLMVARPGVSLSSNDLDDSKGLSGLNKSLTVTKGQQFKLQWNTDLDPTVYTCSSHVSGAGSFSTWGSDVSSSAVLSTNGQPTGTDTFVDTCSDSSGDSLYSQATLIIKSTSEGEI